MAFSLTTFYQFWCYVTPLLGAYIADSYWGRYKTICVAVAVALFGHAILIISAVPGVIEHSSGAMAAFIIGMIIMGLGRAAFCPVQISMLNVTAGTGLFKANISPLIAEQYKRTKLFVITTNKGERVIVDPSFTVSRVYLVRHHSVPFIQALL